MKKKAKHLRKRLHKKAIIEGVCCMLVGLAWAGIFILFFI